MNLRHLLATLALAVCTLACPASALAFGGNYVFDGGTQVEQAQVRTALNASSFDWSLVPAQITIHIAPGQASEAYPGQIFLDANLLGAGKFAWGTIQHEYGHEVDFFLLNDALRARLAQALGVTTWWNDGLHQHAQLGSERFASTLAWAYWPSRANVMRPSVLGSESAAIAPADFRSLVAQLLGIAPLRMLTARR